MAKRETEESAWLRGRQRESTWLRGRQRVENEMVDDSCKPKLILEIENFYYGHTNTSYD